MPTIFMDEIDNHTIHKQFSDFAGLDEAVLLVQDVSIYLIQVAFILLDVVI